MAQLLSQNLTTNGTGLIFGTGCVCAGGVNDFLTVLSSEGSIAGNISINGFTVVQITILILPSSEGIFRAAVRMPRRIGNSKNRFAVVVILIHVRAITIYKADGVLAGLIVAPANFCLPINPVSVGSRNVLSLSGPGQVLGLGGAIVEDDVVTALRKDRHIQAIAQISGSNAGPFHRVVVVAPVVGIDGASACPVQGVVEIDSAGSVGFHRLLIAGLAIGGGEGQLAISIGCGDVAIRAQVGSGALAHGAGASAGDGAGSVVVIPCVHQVSIVMGMGQNRVNLQSVVVDIVGECVSTASGIQCNVLGIVVQFPSCAVGGIFDGFGVGQPATVSHDLELVLAASQFLGDGVQTAFAPSHGICFTPIVEATLQINGLGLAAAFALAIDPSVGVGRLIQLSGDDQHIGFSIEAESISTAGSLQLAVAGIDKLPTRGRSRRGGIYDGTTVAQPSTIILDLELVGTGSQLHGVGVGDTISGGHGQTGTPVAIKAH